MHESTPDKSGAVNDETESAALVSGRRHSRTCRRRDHDHDDELRNRHPAALHRARHPRHEQGVQSASDDDVKTHSAAIFDRIHGIGGTVMPPPPPSGEGPWTQSNIDLFGKWIADSYPP